MGSGRGSFCINILLFLIIASASRRCVYGGQRREEDLLSCLTSHEVSNFTTPRHPTYSHLVDKTLQNLRFVNSPSGGPAVVIYPEKKNQVASAVLCCRQGSWTMRLRSGGHSYEGLSSYADAPFVLIDMVNLNRIKVDVESETAWVEAGATLGQVYHAITEASKTHAFTGGLCASVGAGGHLSGGGYGALARKYGLSSDNVVDALLVDARGRVLDRKSMGEEVFWAIRGGGGGTFGAVVSWKIQMLRVPETIAAFRVARMGSIKEMAEIWYKWQFVAPHLDDEFHLQVAVFPGGEDFIILGFLGLYLGPKPAALDAINEAFPELAITDEECRTMNWAEAVVLLRGDPNVTEYSHLPHRFSYHRTLDKAKSDFVKTPMPKDALVGAMELLTRQRTPAGWLLLDPMGGFLGKAETDFTPFPHRAGNLYAIEYLLQWTREDDEWRAGYVDWLRRIYDYMAPYVAQNPRSAYVNNVDLDLGVIDWLNFTMTGHKAVEVARPWGVKYFLGNYERLVRAKTIIDPENVFRHPQSIPPLQASALHPDQNGFDHANQEPQYYPNLQAQMF